MFGVVPTELIGLVILTFSPTHLFRGSGHTVPVIGVTKFARFPVPAYFGVYERHMLTYERYIFQFQFSFINQILNLISFPRLYSFDYTTVDLPILHHSCC